MDNKKPMTEKEAVALHIAGATVRHRSPFAALPSPTNAAPLSQQIIDEWFTPFYPFYSKPLQKTNLEFVAACARVTPDIILALLREFDWRPRMLAARFIAVARRFEMQEELSTLFLKSEVCYAGRAYCLALARFANDAAAQTLCEYLRYYLGRPDLWFEQNQAMAALLYLDERFGSDFCAEFAAPYKRFIADKPNWDLALDRQSLRDSLAELEEIEGLVRAAAS